MAGLFSHPASNNASQQAAALGLSVSTSVYGLTLPIIYGATRVPGNMIWYGAFTATPQYSQSSSGKGGGSQTTQTGYGYTSSFTLGMCEGPITSINTVWNNGVVDTTDTFTTFTGSPSQSPWGYLSTLDSTKALAYRNLAYIAAANYNLGNTASLPQLTFEVYGLGYGSSVSGIPDVDPVFIITDILTNARYGAGFPAANIGILTSYKAYCITNGLLFSPAYDTTQTAAKAITELLALTNSEAYFSEGLLKITPYSDTAITANSYTYTPNITPIYELGDDAFVDNGSSDPVLVERGSQADAYNQIDIECLDRTNSYNKTSIRATDQVNVDVYGLRSMSNVTAHQICNTAIAQSSAQLILQRNLYIRNKYTFTLPIQYILLEPTDYVTLDDAALGLVSIPVRVLTIDESGDELLITAEDAPAGVGSHAIYGTQTGGGGGVNNLVQPGNTATPQIFVPPSVLTATGLEIWMGAYGATPATWGGCEVWVSYDNVSYAYVGAIDSPARMGTLTATLATVTDPDTTNTMAVNVLSGQALGSATTAEWNNYASLTLVDGEYTAYQTAALASANHYNLTTLHRGLYGSTIASHALGANFMRIDSAMFKMPFTPDKIGQTIYVKLPAFNQFGNQLQQLSSCTASTFTIAISQVPTLSGITLTPVFGGFTIKYAIPTQSDFGGVNVYISATSGFTPGSGNLVYSGPDSLITITADASGTALVGGATYYVRLAGYTTTSKANMSYSSEYSVVPVTPSKNAIASLYQWSSAAPSNPSGASTFTWSTYASSAYTGAGGWSVAAPANPGTPGVQLWIASKVVSDNATATATTVNWASGYSFVIAGANGTNGTNGTAGYQSAIPTVYQWAITIPAAPSGAPTYTWATGLFGAAPSGWTLTAGIAPSPGFTLWAAKVSITDSATATTTNFNWTSSSIVAVGYAGANGTNGTNGTNGSSSTTSLVVQVYQNASSAPGVPSGTITCTFATGALTGGTMGSWTVTQPTSSTTPTYMTQATFTGTAPATTTTTNGGWSTPVIVAQNGTNGTSGTIGSNGNSVYTGEVYLQQASAPGAPSGGSFNFTTSVLTAPTSWSSAQPASTTTPTYMAKFTFSGTGTVAGGTWTTPVIVAQNGSAGTNGTNGTNGTAGAQGASYVTAYCASATATTTTTPATTSGVNSVPATNDGGITGTWSKTVPALSSGQFMYQVDGIYQPTTGYVTWSIPYWSSLKVGSLSAITANLGSITAGDMSGTSLTVGNPTWVSGSAMTGAGAQFNGANGAFMIGNSTGSIIFDLATTRINGPLIYTGNLQDNAATLVQSVYTVGGVGMSISVNPTDVTVQTISVTTIGGQVTILTSMKMAPYTFVANSATFFIKRDGVSVYTREMGTAFEAMIATPYVDSPPAGYHTYTIGFTMTTSQPYCGAYQRLMSIFEARK